MMFEKQRAWIVMSDEDLFDNQSNTYKHCDVPTAVTNIITALTNKFDVKVSGFSTDTVLRSLGIKDVDYVNPLSRSDSYWSKVHCGITDAMSISNGGYEEIVDSVVSKTSPEQLSTLSEYDRFKLVCSNEKKVVKRILANEPVVVIFNFKSKKKYSVTSRPNSPYFRLYVNASTLEAEGYLGSVKLDLNTFLGIHNSTLPVHKWEVINESKNKERVFANYHV